MPVDKIVKVEFGEALPSLTIQFSETVKAIDPSKLLLYDVKAPDEVTGFIVRAVDVP